MLAVVRLGAGGDEVPSHERLISAGCAIQNMLLMATALGFGNQVVGIKSDALPLSITNTGAGPLTISTLHIGGADAADFAQGTDCPIAPDALAPGAATCGTFRPGLDVFLIHLAEATDVTLPGESTLVRILDNGTAATSPRNVGDP